MKDELPADPKSQIQKSMSRRELRNRYPKVYSDEIASYICVQLMSGQSLTSICREETVPPTSTIYNWLDDKNPSFQKDFLESYKRAREFQAETLSDEILDSSAMVCSPFNASKATFDLNTVAWFRLGLLLM